MAKKGFKLEDLVEAVQDDKVIDTLVARLYTRLAPLIESTLSKFREEFTTMLESLVEKSTTEAVSKATADMDVKIKHLEQENTNLKTRMDDMENYTRLDNLVVHGLPESTEPNSASPQSDAPARELILDLCHDRLGLNLVESDISTAHRIFSTNKDKGRPILVRFTTRRARNLVFAARKALRSKSSHPAPAPVYINEHLTKHNANIYAHARKLVREKKIYSTWTAGGFTYIRRTPDEEDKAKQIRRMEDLD